MARLGDGYGSEWNLRWYHSDGIQAFDGAISSAVEPFGGSLEWPYPARAGVAEPTSRDLLEKYRPDLLPAWDRWWPRVRSQPTWDAIGAHGDQLILIEAKANHPEFVGDPCGSTNRENRKRIADALGDVKRELRVHRDYSWLGSYYQYANRLAFLWFLLEHGVAAVLVYVYFTGDRFPDGRWCPASEAEWAPLIEARRLTLGLPKHHAFLTNLSNVFLPAHTAQASSADID